MEAAIGFFENNAEWLSGLLSVVAILALFFSNGRVMVQRWFGVEMATAGAGVTPGEEARRAFPKPDFGGQPALAVLPFANMSSEADQEHFADGLSDDLLTNLQAARHIPVIARNSSFLYKGQAVDIRQVVEELGADYVLEGSVRKAENRVRVTAQLIDKHGAHVWAERYDRELDDIFAVQDDLADKIAASVTGAIDERESVAAVEPEPEEPEEVESSDEATAEEDAEETPHYGYLSDRSRGAALVLCAALGVFGIHRFYAGRPLTGILQFLTAGGFFIWMLIDLIRILFGWFRDKNKRQIKLWFGQAAA